MSDRPFLRCALPGAALLGLFCHPAQGQTPPVPIQVVVDARDAPRRVLHAELTFPVQPGPLTLLYPQWIPGEHGPTGPLLNVVGLHFTADGHALPWQRDGVNLYAVRVTVPPGATQIQADFDYLYTSDTDGFGSGAAATPNLAVVAWNQVVLYPAGAKSDGLTYVAQLRLPDGWQYGTALPLADLSVPSVISFAPVSLTRLVDSPVATGKYLRRYPLGNDGPHSHELDLVADSAEALTLPAPFLASCRNLVGESGALFGARHYGNYHFLYVLSDRVAGFGLEHHESSQDQDGERAVLDDDTRPYAGGLLTHEFAHSWNGKYRRPAGLATGDYHTPMQGELLWIYEGLTEYLGIILEPRCRFDTSAQFQDELASAASQMSLARGRSWRPLADTAIAAQALYNSPSEWGARRRGVDFYSEGAQLWLEVDTLIRRKSGNRRSLDDFLHRFHGGTDTTIPEVKPYTLSDVVTALNEVQPYDWQGFFQKRVYDLRPLAPTEGLENSGWRLVYNDTPNAAMKASEAARKSTDLASSLGFVLDKDDKVTDVVPDSPADRAGVDPGDKITGLNGRALDRDQLKEAVGHSGSTAAPITLTLLEGNFEKTATLDYHAGALYPHLARISGRPDLLTQIAAPRLRAAANR